MKIGDVIVYYVSFCVIKHDEQIIHLSEKYENRTSSKVLEVDKIGF